MKLKLLLLAILFTFSVELSAQSYFLDTTFNATGTVKGKKVFNNLNGMTKAVAVDGLGRIFMITTPIYGDTTYVIRLKSDGTSDAASSTGIIAKIVFDSLHISKCLAIQSDGKILIGGGIYRWNERSNMMVIRLHADGSPDVSFGVNGMWTKADLNVNASVTKIALQTNDKIIIAGTSRDYNTAYLNDISVLCLTSNGKEDTGFNSYLSKNNFDEYTTGLDLHKDTIIVGGNYSVINAGSATTYYYSAVKLSPNGTPYSTFGWPGGRIDLPTMYMISSNEGGLAVQDDGDIFLGANNGNSGFKLYRISPDGKDTSSYTFGTDWRRLTNLLVDSDGKLILTGYVVATVSSYIAIKVNELGKVDSTFAQNGRFSLADPTQSQSYKSYHSTFSKDGKLFLVGSEGGASVYPSILKVYIKPPMHIMGSEYVLPNSSETYRVLMPNSDNYTFDWSIPSGQNVFSFPGIDSKKTTLFFGSGATKIRLTCTALSASGVPVMKVEKDILVNTNSTSANDLDSLECPTSITDCSTGYIDYFKLNLIRNDSSGCSSGYADYTKSPFIDSLVVGGVYSATLRVDEPKMYVGIWIDYNDDGIFNTSDEFVAETFSNNTFIQIPNIILKNESGYFGSKRLRVRCRANTSFSSVESCPIEGEGGETEDYLVVLIKQDELAAPQIITPNEDGKNDYFVVRGVKPDSKNQLTIFDRWGKVKFSAEDYENNWNGTSKGEKLLPGTYYYLFTNDKKVIKGFLEIRY